MVVQTFQTVKKIVIKVFIVRYYLPLRDSESVRYIRFVISEFVISVTFCKDLLRINLGLKKTLLYSRFCYMHVHTIRVLLYY